MNCRPLRALARASSTLTLLTLTLAPATAQRNPTLIEAPRTRGNGSEPYATTFAASRAVVHVVVEVQGRNVFRIERPSSGVVIAPGLVATLWSLVREAENATDKRLFVQLGDAAKTRYPAKLMAQDAKRDLALLQVELPPGVNLATAQLDESAHVGDPAAALSLPDGDDQIAFAGVVVAPQADIAVGEGATRRTLARTDFLLTDAAIQPRSHGGALLSARGTLLGLCCADRVVAEIREPTLDDLKRPSFGFVIPSRMIAAAFASQLGSAGKAPASAPSEAAQVLAKVADSIVAVHGTDGDGAPIGDSDPFAMQRRAGVGSGVVVASNGLILTNRHLVADAQAITVRRRDGKTCAAKLLAEDRRTNVALVQVAPTAGLVWSAIACARADSVAIGTPLLALGNPEGHTVSLARGVLSAVRSGRLQTDAATGNHNGGGALITLAGELIGLCDAGVRDAIDMAFAMRGDQAKVDTSLNMVPSVELLRNTLGEALDRHADASAPILAPQPSRAAAGPVAAVVERVGLAMLNIYVEITTAAAEVEDNPFAEAKGQTTVEGLGSGAVIDASGLALTNWHVVDSATEPDGSMRRDRVVKASLRDGRVFPARVLSISREEDLALLQLELKPGETLPAVELGASDSLTVGDLAIAIGNPMGRANTVTAGIVTAKNQAINVRGRWAKLKNLFETDAAINAGNSGGALLDRDGRLIGINSAGGSLHAVTGFAIAVDHVRERLRSLLLAPEKLRSPYLGIAVLDQAGRAVVQNVDRSGPAAAHDVQTGDVILAVGGRPIANTIDFALAALTLDPTATTELQLERGGKRARASFAPLSAAAWAVARQTGLLTEEVTIQREPAIVRDAALAFYRHITGDPTAEPSELPERLVRVVRLLPAALDRKVDLAPGDLLLGVQLRQDATGADAEQLLRCHAIHELQALINRHSTYEGENLRAYAVRQSAVRSIDLPTKRLML